MKSHFNIIAIPGLSITHVPITLGWVPDIVFLRITGAAAKTLSLGAKTPSEETYDAHLVDPEDTPPVDRYVSGSGHSGYVKSLTDTVATFKVILTANGYEIEPDSNSINAVCNIMAWAFKY